MRSQNRWLYAGFVLLALACVPTSARAGSAEKVYVPELPTVESKGAEATPKPTAPNSRSSRPKPTTETATAPEGETETKERRRTLGATPGGGDRPPGNGRDRRDDGASKPPAGPGRTVPVRHERPATGVETSTGGGRSSPVVPILVAMAVLAAASIGVVIYRARAARPGRRSLT